MMQNNLIQSLLCFLTLFITFLPHLTYADDHNEGDFYFKTSLRLRYEFADWTTTADSTSKSEHDFGHTKFRFGGGFKNNFLKAYVEGQYSQLFNLPSNSVGPGAAYFNLNDADSSPGDVFLRQGFIDFKHWGLREVLSLKLGRFLFKNGLESKDGSSGLKWLKKARLAERLIGSFDYTFGRSFDGFQANYHEFGLPKLTVIGFRPTEGGFFTDGMRQIEEIDLIGGVLTSDASFWQKNVGGEGEAQLFYYFYGDERDGIEKADSRAVEDFEQIEISSYGASWVQEYPSENLTFDSLVWGVVQDGKWGTDDHFAYAYALETGVRFEDLLGKPWVRVGYNYSSGDNDASDGDHQTFFPLLPTMRKYARTAFYSQMNLQDAFVQIIWKPLPKLLLRSDYRALWVNEENDLLYSGSGANRESGSFGYSGIQTGGDRYIGSLFDLSLNYRISKILSATMYVSHLVGGNVMENNFVDHDLDKLYFEFLAKY